MQIAEDATMLAQSANSEVIFRTRTAYCNRMDAERRKGIFGRVDELLRKLDGAIVRVTEGRLPTNTISLKMFNSAADELISWDVTVNKLFSKLTDEPTKACIAAGLLEELEKFPDQAPWHNELNGQGFRAVVAQADPDLAGQIAGASARYTATIKLIKKSMQQRVDLHAPKNT
jgi:hypothetical protein